MKKTKSILTYLLVSVVVIALFSSFETDMQYTASSKIGRDEKNLYLIFAERTDDVPSVTPNDPQTEPSPSPTRQSEYKMGDSSTFVTHYKTLLWQLGFYAAEKREDITPEFDEALKNAVEGYQKSLGMMESGILDEATMTQLDAQAPQDE